MSVGVGDRAPEFTLPGTGGEKYSLADFRGNPLVIVFYPGDDTPVCTKQLNAYNDDLDRFTDCEIIHVGDGSIEGKRAGAALDDTSRPFPGPRRDLPALGDHGGSDIRTPAPRTKRPSARSRGRVRR